uniref:Uncharacterized protein n=1 Tax=Timspurckia oligopyrenoides TaxID=708627 RepID=A0A7S1ERY8_9RHOD|mmetsp:Transcript_2810/g.4949  ORF Transcript_2810/g.4949 Transcript_2810/m.4949 type:complete len:183 (+) Transcript_2810:92-640(+)
MNASVISSNSGSHAVQSSLSSKIICIGILAPKNQPLLISITDDAIGTSENTLPNKVEIEEAMYNLIDIFEDSLSNPAQTECYLGLLQRLNSIAFYGFHSCTKHKIILGIHDHSHSESKSIPIKSIMQDVHRIIIAAHLNIFHTIDEQYTSSPRLISSINAIISQKSPTNAQLLSNSAAGKEK